MYKISLSEYYMVFRTHIHDLVTSNSVIVRAVFTSHSYK